MIKDVYISKNIDERVTILRIVGGVTHQYECDLTIVSKSVVKGQIRNSFQDLGRLCARCQMTRQTQHARCNDTKCYLMRFGNVGPKIKLENMSINI